MILLGKEIYIPGLWLLCSIPATLAWGPANGFPGTLDLRNNIAMPPEMQTYQMNRSLVCYFVGNDTAGNSAEETAAEGRFGVVGIGWQLSAIASNFTHLEAYEVATARRLKAQFPEIKVMVTRNTDCGGLNWDIVKAALNAHPEYFLRDSQGTVFQVPWVANDPSFFHHQNFYMMSPYFNYSNPDATRWWLETYIGNAVSNDLFSGVYWDACGPQAPPTKQASYPCPGRKLPPVEPDCKYPKPLAMSRDEVSRYYVDAHAAFTKAQEMIAAAGKWSSTWAAEGFSNMTCCRGCTPECRPSTIPECVASVVKLVEAANMENHTMQLKVPMPTWSATSEPPFDGSYLDYWVKLFLLVRGPQSLLYFPGQGDAFAYSKDFPAPFPDSMNRDYGTPLQDSPTLGPGPGGPLSVFVREWTQATVTFDCSSFDVMLVPKAEAVGGR